MVVCPDKFAGTLTAVEAADAIAAGWCRERPGDEVRTVPVADGGPGFLEVLHATLGGTLHEARVSDPLGRPVTAQWLEVDDTAYIEAAQANGLALVAPSDRDVWSADTRGVGELIAAARGRRIVVGLGGSGTNDGGRGAFEALDGRAVPGLVIASDVDSPLLGPHGATYGYARQKGASEDDLPALEERMREWARRGPSLADAPGAGAAGGLGFGLMLLGGRRVAGIDLVMDAVGLRTACAQADVVITGEGRFDWQSLRGKAVSGVLRLAPGAVILAGSVDVRGYAAHSLLEHCGDRALTEPAAALADLAAFVARGAAGVS